MKQIFELKEDNNFIWKVITIDYNCNKFAQP